ncbi:MAG: hypothetical protein M3Z33_06145 [Actinomycetota bacterium]|nr:hypothetical protein [Actinomycetota bacterium]
MRRLVMVIVVLGGVGSWVLPAVAGAQTAKVTQHVFDELGDPLLIANSIPDGSKGTVTWAICPAAGSCRPAGTGAELKPGEQPAGTTFDATVDYGGQVSSDRSKPWLGRVRATGAPRLDGKPVVGERVTPMPGPWSGGWGDESEDLRVQACRSPAGTDCKSLSAPIYHPQATDPAVVVSAAYVGWYLFAVDGRLPKESVFAAVGYLSPEGAPPLAAGPTVAISAALGPVVGPTGPRATPRKVVIPTVTLRKRVRARRFTLGSVHCPTRCRVRLQVKRNGTVRTTRLRVAKSARLLVPKGVRQPGAVRVTVWVDGTRLISRRVRIV